MTRSKYNAKPVIIDGHRFASLREGARYRVLSTWQAAGIIRDLELQPKFILLAGYRRENGKWERPTTYVADFRYVERGLVVVEDVKGVKTETYKLKRKWFQFLNPTIQFKEVK
jgi:hypothetical protein